MDQIAPRDRTSLPPLVDDHHDRWVTLRSDLEEHFPYGCGRPFRYRYLGWMESILRHSLKVCGLYKRGLRNALDISLNRFDLAFEQLPAEFDGYRILQVSDMHFGCLPGLDDAVLSLIAQTEADIAVFTGDYIGHRYETLDAFEAQMERITATLTVRDGLFAILGNHDSVHMAAPFHRLGIQLLANRSIDLGRDGATVTLTGIDDVYLFHTPMADEALRESEGHFKILLAHSPHMAEPAAEAGYALYLAGHTHGGQICLPGGRPLYAGPLGERERISGTWKVGAMTGYTTSGAGVSAIPVRFNTRGEIALITLRRA